VIGKGEGRVRRGRGKGGVRRKGARIRGQGGSKGEGGGDTEQVLQKRKDENNKSFAGLTKKGGKMEKEEACDPPWWGRNYKKAGGKRLRLPIEEGNGAVTGKKINEVEEKRTRRVTRKKVDSSCN